MSRGGAAVSGVLVAALALMDVTYMSVFVRSDILQVATGLQTLVFLLQIFKTASVFAVKDLREASGSILVDVYGAELFLLPAFLAAYLGLHVASAPMLMRELIVGWTVGVAFAGSPLVVYRLGRGMLRSERLAVVLPLGVAVSEVGVLLSNGAAGAASAGTGLEGVAAAFIGRGTVVPSGVPLDAAAGAVYASLLAYAVLGWSGRPAVELNRALAFGVGATLLAAGWAVLAASLSLGTDLAFVPPALAGILLSWWLARGK